MKFVRRALLSIALVALCRLGCFGSRVAEAAGAPARAGMAELEVGQAGWSGYFKTYGIGLFSSQGFDGSGYQQLSDFRLNGFWRPTQAWKLEAGYELLPIWQSESLDRLGLSSASAANSPYRLADLHSRLSNRLYQNLDRAAAYWHSDGVDVSIGRQAITFGSAHVIQTTDVLLPFSFQQLNTEYRIGVDALRAQVPISRMGEVDLGVVVGRDARAEESAAFLRVKANWVETDLVAMAMAFSGAKLVGGGLQRGIWVLGYNLDFAQVWAPGGESYFRLSQGLDYSFESGLVLFAEYHFNGAGAASVQSYPAVPRSFAWSRGGVFLVGRNYFIPGLAYPVTPLLNARLQSLWNAEDGSLFVSGGLEYGMTENLYLDCGTLAPLGAKDSEFGRYPAQLYGALRYYF